MNWFGSLCSFVLNGVMLAASSLLLMFVLFVFGLMFCWFACVVYVIWLVTCFADVFLRCSWIGWFWFVFGFVELVCLPTAIDFAVLTWMVCCCFLFVLFWIVLCWILGWIAAFGVVCWFTFDVVWLTLRYV